MHFKYTNVYLLSFVLFLPNATSTSNSINLKLTKWSFDGPKLLHNISTVPGKISQSFYKYSYTKDELVYFTCEVDSFKNLQLMWKIASTPEKTDCQQKNVRQLNYITKLTDSQNGNNLTCYLAGKHRAIAVVNLQCPKCNGKIPRKLDSRCYSTNDTINIYFNGQFVRDLNISQEISATSTVIIHCEIEVDDYHVVEFDTVNNEITNFTQDSRFQKRNFSKSVIAYKLIMTDSLDDRMINCQKKRITDGEIVARRGVRLKLISKFFIEINQSNKRSESYKPWQTHRTLTEVPYKNNDMLNLTCNWKGVRESTLKWLKNDQLLTPENKSRKIINNLVLTPTGDGTKITCQLNYKNERPTNRTIVLKYIQDPKGNTSKNPNNPIVDSSNKVQTGHEQSDGSKRIIIIVVGLVIILVVVIAFIFYICKKPRSVPSSVAQSAISYTNFQNTTPEPPVLESMYSGPVDDVNMYAYTYNLKTTQEIYNTPFVPTLEELYTKPTPKILRQEKETVYQLPGKSNYSNLQVARQNQLDPGYSNVSGDTSNTESDVYIYSSAYGYSRPT